MAYGEDIGFPLWRHWVQISTCLKASFQGKPLVPF
jgi:hypothetical protein